MRSPTTHVKHWGRVQTVRYLRDLRTACRLVAENPLLGASSDEVLPGLRRMAKGSHVIYYRQRHKGVSIVRVLHRRMLPGLRFSAEDL